jgi:hypothetical protein
LLALKWRNIHRDLLTVERRYCRGDWSTPKTKSSAATISVDNAVIARVHRLKTLTVDVKAGLATRHYKVVKSAQFTFSSFNFCAAGLMKRRKTQAMIVKNANLRRRACPLQLASPPS